MWSLESKLTTAWEGEGLRAVFFSETHSSTRQPKPVPEMKQDKASSTCLVSMQHPLPWLLTQLA